MSTTHVISEFMTNEPHVLDCSQSIAEAAELMADLHVRHLPVIDRGRLVGVLSERDIFRIRSAKRVDPEVVAAGEAMTPEPYIVAPDDALSDVVRAMAEHHYGAAVVMDGTEIVGVFTTIDALWVLTTILEKRQGH
jgi:CBS domain-containing protein